MPDSLIDLLQPQRLSEIVDIGANPIDGDPPYKAMLTAGLCRVVGFEPQPEALAALEAARGPNERYLPWAVGDGGVHELKVCRGSGMSSLLEPDIENLALFPTLAAAGQVIQRLPIQTRRLDDIAEIARIDLLKIDVQGGELAVFVNGRARLAEAVAVHTEVSFVTLYRKQPPFGVIDLELRQQGFVPHAMTSLKKRALAPCVVNGDPSRPIHQLVEADMVYVRDPARTQKMSQDQLRQLALIAHHVYGSIDLAIRCIAQLEESKALPAGSLQHYFPMAAAIPPPPYDGP